MLTFCEYLAFFPDLSHLIHIMCMSRRHGFVYDRIIDKQSKIARLFWIYRRRYINTRQDFFEIHQICVWKFFFCFVLYLLRNESCCSAPFPLIKQMLTTIFGRGRLFTIHVIECWSWITPLIGIKSPNWFFVSSTKTTFMPVYIAIRCLLHTEREKIIR